MKLTIARRCARAGMTMIEIAITSVLLIMLSGALTQSLMHMRDVTDVGDVRTLLHDEAEKALASVMVDLRRSGFGTLAGATYPYLFDDGNAFAPYFVHAHAAAIKTAQAGDADFGANREIVVLQPLMGLNAAGQDVAALDANGLIQWSPNVVSYVVITGADGRNWLQRRVNGANPRRIIPDVERIAFDTNATDPVNVPVGAVRVQLFLRRVDDEQVVHRHATELMINLRN